MNLECRIENDRRPGHRRQNTGDRKQEEIAYSVQRIAYVEDLKCKTKPISKDLNRCKFSYHKGLRRYMPTERQEKQSQFKPNHRLVKECDFAKQSQFTKCPNGRKLLVRKGLREYDPISGAKKQTQFVFYRRERRIRRGKKKYKLNLTSPRS